MTNRTKYFTGMNEYDLLIKILENSKQCPLMLIDNKYKDRELCTKYFDCKLCIQKWLNTEVN